MPERSAVVKQLKKGPKSLEFVHTNSDDSDTKNEQEPVVKLTKTVPKSPDFVDTDSDD